VVLAVSGSAMWNSWQMAAENLDAAFVGEASQEASQMGWECRKDAQYNHKVHLRSKTHLVKQGTPSNQAVDNQDQWFFSVWGQVEESCLQMLDEHYGQPRWLVHYRWLADGLEQNVQKSDLNFQSAISLSLREGIFVERTASNILSLSQTQETDEVAYELWRMFLLSQTLCDLPAEDCQESWLDDHFIAQYSYLDGDQSWQKNAQLNRSSRHPNQVQSLSSVIQGQSNQMRAHDLAMTLRSEQQTSWALSRDETVVTVKLQDLQVLAAGEQQRLLQLHRQAELVLQNGKPVAQRQTELERIYQQELVSVQEADLWLNYDASQNRTDRYLQIKAWVYLNRHQLDKVRAELLSRAADDALLRLWIKALGQTGGASGQQILVDTVLARAEERSLVKYTLAGLAFAEEPADSLDQILQGLIDDERIPADLHINVLLTLGTWAGRLTGERADLLSRFLLDRWSLVTTEEEKMALIQAIGNSGYQGAKALLIKVIEQEKSQKLVVEAVFALRFVAGAFDHLLDFLRREPHQQGAIRALRFVRLDEAEVQLTLNRISAFPEQAKRYQIISSFLQNPVHRQMSPAIWNSYMDREKDAKILEIIQNHLEYRALSGS